MKESLDTSFSVMLSKSDIFIILDCLRAGSMEPVTGLIEHLERELSRRDTFLRLIAEENRRPDFLVGI